MTEPVLDDAQPAVTVPAVAFDGRTADMVYIQAFTGAGQPGVQLVGLPADAVRPTHNRLYAAVVNSGLFWPASAPVLLRVPNRPPVGDSGPGCRVRRRPAGRHRPACPPMDWPTWPCVGGLGLDGQLRMVSGLPQRATAISHAGLPASVVPTGDLAAAVRILGNAARAAGAPRPYPTTFQKGH